MIAFVVKKKKKKKEKKKLKCPAFSVEGRKGSLFGRIIYFSALTW